jgi:hypothetical protein
MAVARIFECKGWTWDQYDALLSEFAKEYALPPGVPGPGNMFHWVTETKDSLLATAVYESIEAADKIGASIGRIAGLLGLPAPKVTQHQVRTCLKR